jgi:hypothetical protein
MPRFFFESRDGAHLGPDDQGLEFPDQAAAELEAAQTAAAMLRDAVGPDSVGEVTITLLDETGRRLSHLTASLSIKPAQP